MNIREKLNSIDFSTTNFNMSKEVGMAWHHLLKLKNENIKYHIERMKEMKYSGFSLVVNIKILKESIRERKKILKRILEEKNYDIINGEKQYKLFK